MEEGLVFRGCQLPPGFRFQPTDQEIILCYLGKKVASASAAVTSIIADVDIYKFDPWDLPGNSPHHFCAYMQAWHAMHDSSL
jgi:hypothetical protein